MSSVTSQADILIHLMLTELKCTPLYNASLDLVPIKIQVAKINPILLAQLSNQLLDVASPLGLMIPLIVQNVQTVLKDDQVTLADAPAVMNILSGMYHAIGSIDQVNVSSAQLIDVVTDIVSIILSMIIVDPIKLKNLTAFVESCAVLIKFEMPSKGFFESLSAICVPNCLKK